MKSSNRNYILWILIIFLCSKGVLAQVGSTRNRIAGIIAQAKGHVGIAIMDLENLDSLTFNNNYRYPMQSVYKFPLALAVLSKIDKGILSFNQIIHLTKDELHPNTWSPLRKKYPEGNIDITLRELLKYTVAESDNNGCDILFRIMGGPAKVNQYISNLGIKGMSIAATEEEMHQEWSVQYKNYSTPFAMVNLLYKFSRDSILSAPSKKFLWNIMTQNIFGSKRISGQLPAGTIVAQKTGTSDVNNGIAAATNDAGVVTLPNGRQFAIVAFIADSPDNEITRDKIIADIAKAVWNAYLNN